MALAAEAALSISSIVDEVQDVVKGYVRVQERHTELLTPLTDSATTFAVADGSALSVGLTEIDDELVYVSAVDVPAATATVPTWGRGQSGSTAAAHAAGARVTLAPFYPRQRVAAVVYGVLREIFPAVFAVGEVALTVDPAVTNHAMPDDCWHILGVEWQVTGPSRQWIAARRWRQNKTATAVELELLSVVSPGSDQARVFYVRTPPTAVDGTDDLGMYGYDLEVRDLIVAGAASRLMAHTETARVQSSSVESNTRNEVVPAGTALAISKYLFQLFQARLEAETRQIQMRHPIQLHRTR